MKRVVVFRVDASRDIGLGHLMRCLVFAEALYDLNFEVHFIMKGSEMFNVPNDYTLHLIDSFSVESQIDTTIYTINKIGTVPELLVVDSYELDSSYHAEVRPYVKRVLVIDDMANRKYECDFILDPTPRNGIDLYSKLAPNAIKLLGPEFVLLRKEFRQLRERYHLELMKNNGLNRIFVSFGATDTLGLSIKTLEAIAAAKLTVKTDVMISSHSLIFEELLEYAKENQGINLLVDIKEPASWLARADLAIGAAGSTSWERCCLGVPSIVLSIAKNQDEIALGLERYGAAKVLEYNSEIYIEELTDNILELSSNNAMINTMSEASYAVCDGEGVSRLVSSLGISEEVGCGVQY